MARMVTLVRLASFVAALAMLAARRVGEPWFFLLVPAAAALLASLLGSFGGREQDIPRRAPIALFLVGASVFFLLSAHRHWQFGSGSRDLGLFYQSHWLMAHGQIPFSTVLGKHIFADHLTFLDCLVAPVLWLRDDADALLFVQALAAASGVFPLFALGRRLVGSEGAGLALAGAWVLAPDLHSGVMFDYNPNQMAAAGLLWTAWALLFRGAGLATVLALLTCFAKENLCLYIPVVAGVLAFRGAPWRRCALVAGLALFLFVVEMLVVFPRFGGFAHFDYEDLGTTPAAAASSAVREPLRALRILVDAPEKRQAILQPLAATGFLGLADPVSLVLQVPNWAERLLSSRRTRWWGYHYGSLAAATALLGAALGWRRLVSAGRAGRVGAYLALCALLVGLFPPYRTAAGNPRSDLYVLHPPYASDGEDVLTQRKAVRFIGREPRIAVAAQYNLLPHLAGRPRVFMLEEAELAAVVALQLNGGTWPAGRAGWRRAVFRLWDTEAFWVAFCEGKSVVLVRGQRESVTCPSFDALLASRRPNEGPEDDKSVDPTR